MHPAAVLLFITAALVCAAHAGGISQLLPLAQRLTFFSAGKSARLPASERRALVELHTALGGRHWVGGSNRRWLRGCPCRNAWFGVACREVSPNRLGVVKVTVWAASSTPGQLPRWIDHDSLRALRKSTATAFRKIGRRLPPDVVREHIRTYLEKTPPPTTLPHLESLFIAGGGSNLTGALPESYGSMKNLRMLRIDLSSINGTIPATYGNLQKLENLTLVYTNITGGLPKELCRLHNLHTIALYENKLDGQIPDCIAKLPKLAYMLVQGNRLRGPVPARLGGMPTLRSLNMRKNNFSTPYPASVVQRFPTALAWPAA